VVGVKALAGKETLDPGAKKLFDCKQLPQLQEVAVNKSELIEAVGTTAGLDKRSAQRAVVAFLDTVVSEVKGGKKVTLVGFGTFTPKSRSARTGRNPRTGEPVRVKASKSVAFSPGSTFKEALNTRGSVKKAASKATAKSGSKAAAKSTNKSTAKATKASRGTAKATKASPAKRTSARTARAASSTTVSRTTARAAGRRR
jgi:DNA-binding protein HU-beta